ncbi:MAG: carbohydrate binding domain-containing protein, partial [Thermoguttaceae bacterium]
MRLLLAFLLVGFLTPAALSGDNLVKNPSFEEQAKGSPAEWRTSGDAKLVTQTLTLDAGRVGRRCAKLACTRFAAGNPAAHAMLCQMGVPIKRGKNYHITSWARGEQIEAETVAVALSDTSVWTNCGLESTFIPTPQWTRYEFLFQAKRDCADKSRLQIWFTSTGTLWIDDVVLEETGAELYRPTNIIPAGKG